MAITKIEILNFVRDCKSFFQKSGYRRLRLRTLLNCFGFKRRGSKNLVKIRKRLREHNVYLNTSLTKYQNLFEIGLDDWVYIYPYPAGVKGILFESELKFQEVFYRNKLYKYNIIGKLKMIDREYSPQGTYKRMDFLCKDNDDCYVVVELKNADGNRRAVQQILEYIGSVRSEKNCSNVRGILITGTIDPETLHAMHGLDNENLITWFKYWLRKDGLIKFAKISKGTIKDYISKIG
jgi:hypothetical protein